MSKGRPLRSVRRLANNGGWQPKWYKITNSATADAPTMVSIYDEIGFYGVSAGEFLSDLKQVGGNIELHINSPGGDVFDGIAIYNTLKQRQGDVHVIVDGLAASAASFIAMAASPGKLEIAPHAQMMIHEGFAMGIGNAGDMRSLADQLDSVSENIAGIYADRTGKPTDYWRGKMKDETWYTDAEAVADGLADRIHGQADADPSEEWDLSVFASYAGVSMSASSTVIVNADGTHPPMTGSHSHSHTANGDQGGDDMHDHSHTHDGDASHGHTHDDPDGDGDDDTSKSGDTDHDYAGANPPKKVPAGNRGLFPVLAADVDNSSWDAAKAWAAGADSDDPAAFYKGICAGRKAGDPSTQDAWALPYKYSPSSPPNASGVRNALSRLPQTKGLTNEAEARATLEKAMKAVNPDYDPDDSIDTELLAELFAIGLEGSR